MSKKELNNLKQRISEIALSIKEQEAFTMQIQDFLSRTYPEKLFCIKNNGQDITYGEDSE